MKTKIPIKLLKLEDGFHLLVNMRVNGKPARMLIDTGASKTVFDKERSARFISSGSFEKHDKLSTGLGTSTMKSHLAVIGSISLGNVEIRNYKTVVIDLSHVNVAYGQLKQKPIEGVLGSDILKKYKAVIDYGAKKLVLSSYYTGNGVK
ncbi:MAG: clan AA aspartic protease [Bacteroidetes bacterium]|nr:MAG: clan AA aspartic protease [Bacteroidota bacterium]